jgi:hypothetical protein
MTDGTYLYLYLDGRQAASPVLRQTGTISSSSDCLTVGALPNGCGAPSSGYFWAGLIDEVRIYNRVLSAEEIATLYALKPSAQP